MLPRVPVTLILVSFLLPFVSSGLNPKRFERNKFATVERNVGYRAVRDVTGNETDAQEPKANANQTLPSKTQDAVKEEEKTTLQPVSPVNGSKGFENSTQAAENSPTESAMQEVKPPEVGNPTNTTTDNQIKELEIPITEASAEEVVKPVTERPTKEPEKPVTGSPTKEPQKPVIGSPTKEPEKPVTERPTKEPQKPVTERPTKEPEKPVTERPTKEPEKPVTERPTKEPQKTVTERPTKGLETPVAETKPKDVKNVEGNKTSAEVKQFMEDLEKLLSYGEDGFNELLKISGSLTNENVGCMVDLILTEWRRVFGIRPTVPLKTRCNGKTAETMFGFDIYPIILKLVEQKAGRRPPAPFPFPGHAHPPPLPLPPAFGPPSPLLFSLYKPPRLPSPPPPLPPRIPPPRISFPHDAPPRLPPPYVPPHRLQPPLVPPPRLPSHPVPPPTYVSPPRFPPQPVPPPPRVPPPRPPPQFIFFPHHEPPRLPSPRFPPQEPHHPFVLHKIVQPRPPPEPMFSGPLHKPLPPPEPIWG